MSEQRHQSNYSEPTFRHTIVISFIQILERRIPVGRKEEKESENGDPHSNDGCTAIGYAEPDSSDDGWSHYKRLLLPPTLRPRNRHASHPGIYIGGNKVVHFTEQRIGSSEDSSVTSSGSTPGSAFSFSSVTSSGSTRGSAFSWGSAFSSSAEYSMVSPTTCQDISDCGSRQPESGVILSCLDCFLSTGSLCRFEYGVSTAVYIAKFRGGCTTAKSDPPQEVIHRAMHLHKNGFGNYDLLRNNCEDFALYCKTGLLVDVQRGPGRSGQAACAIGAICVPVGAIVSYTLKFFTSSPVGVVTTTAGTYCMNRYAADIGVRTDVVKVEVEDMVVFRGRDGRT